MPKKAEICRAGASEYKTDIDFVIAGGKRRRAGQMTYSNEERAGCNQAIDAIEKFIETNKKELIKKDSKNAYLEATAHLKSLADLFEYINLHARLQFSQQKSDAATAKRNYRKSYEEGDGTRWEIFFRFCSRHAIKIKRFFSGCTTGTR